MPTRWGNHFVPTQLGIVMGVRIDKTGRDDFAGGVYLLVCRFVDAANGDDFTVVDCQVGLIAGFSGAINDGAITNDQVKGHDRLLSRVSTGI